MLSFRNFVALFFVVLLTACAAPSSQVAEQPSVIKKSFVFIDLDSFDEKMAGNFSANANEFEVLVHGDTVSMNNIPERMQRWLSLVDQKGQGLELKSESGVQPKSLSMIMAMAPQLFQYLENQYQKLLISDYKAVVYLADGSSKINKIVFKRNG